MATADRNPGRETELPELIRRQIGTAINRRHLSRIPAFALDQDLPDEMARLLAELDAAERGARRLSRKG